MGIDDEYKHMLYLLKQLLAELIYDDEISIAGINAIEGVLSEVNAIEFRIKYGHW